MKSNLIRGVLASAFLLLVTTCTLQSTVVVNDDVSNNLNEEVGVSITRNEKVLVSEGEPSTEITTEEFTTEEEIEELETELPTEIEEIETGVGLAVEEVDIMECVDMDTKMYTTSSLNVRPYPNTECEPIGKLPIRSNVHVVGKYDEEWYKIEYEDGFAFVNANYLSDKQLGRLIKVNATAYYNPNGNKTADGSDTIANFTLAGMKEWYGRGCYLYRCNQDGSKGECMGYYEFHDTGWGLGQIPKGETIDIYMETYDECMNWGRRKVWVEFVD